MEVTTGSTTNSGDITIPATVANAGITYDVTSIGAQAFCYCTGLTSVVIPNSVTSIGENAFGGCEYLTSVTLSSSLTSIGKDAFTSCRRLTSLTLPNSVISIGDYAFCGCYNLTSLTLPNSVTSIGEYAFEQCNGLTSLTLSSSLTSIPESAFMNCKHLTSVIIPNSVSFIGVAAFRNCSRLTTVTLPNSVTYFGGYAFDDCSALTVYNSQIEDPSSLDVSDFLNRSTATLNIPFGTTAKYSSWGFTAANVHETAVITISSSGSATYCSPKALDFSAVEGLDAYVATSYNSGELTATRCDKVPANTGVLLKGTPGVYVLPEYTGSVSPVATNMFVGINTDATVDVTTTKSGNEYTNLVLAVVGGELGFYNLIASGTLATHKAYLPILTSALNVIGSSKKITINFNNGGATDIKGVELNTLSDDTIYNLQGQKVVNPERGIYIVNGKKTYIK